MTYENKAGLGVNNQYGPRDTGGAIGLEHGYNSTHTLSIQITPEFVRTGFIPPVNIPKGAMFVKAILRVDEAFSLTGTTPALVYGEAGAETTNGISLSKAELEAVGTKTPASTGTGTWAIGTGATTAVKKIGKTLTGTTPAVAGNAGKAVLILHYFNKTKA